MKQINIPKFIGKYKLQEIVGRGAHGRVYRACDTESGRVVAVKLVSASRFRQDLKQSINYEMDLLKRLDHCNIVKYIDTVQSGQFFCIILEYVDGGSLESLLTRIGTFSEALTAVYIRQVLKGLDYLHTNGIIHRDIKGGNILVTLDGVVKLADFGVATQFQEGEKRQHMSIAGTPYWMAPEVIEQKGHITSACDIWSVGCTVFELLTGKPPRYSMVDFAAMIKIVNEQMPLPEDITPELRDFLQRCFVKDPSKRPDARTLLAHPWLTQQDDTSKLAQILSLNPPLEVSNTIKIHLSQKGGKVQEPEKKFKKIIQDGKLVQVNRSKSSAKPISVQKQAPPLKVEKKEHSDPDLLAKKPQNIKMVQKNQQTLEQQIKKIPSSRNVQGKALNTSNEQPKVIPFAKIQQACKNVQQKVKKINLVQVSDKTPPVRKSRNAIEAGKPLDSSLTTIQDPQPTNALMQQSKSFQEIQDSTRARAKPGQLYDLRNHRRENDKVEDENKTSNVGSNAGSERGQDSETQSKKQRSKARMIGRGFSMLAASCLSSNQPAAEDQTIAANESAQAGSDILSRLVHDSKGKQKENTRQNSGMTKQLANLLSQHQGFDHAQHQNYVTGNSHQSNKSYPSNSNIPILPKANMIGHGHTVEHPGSVKSVLSNGPQFAHANSHNISANENLEADEEAKTMSQKIGSQRSLPKVSSANALPDDTARKKGSHKNTASFLNKFQVEELNNRAQYQMFNNPPTQTMETPTANPTSNQSFDLLASSQPRRNGRDTLHQQRLTVQNFNLALSSSPQLQFQNSFQNSFQSSLNPDPRQRTVSYGAKFAAAGPASSQQIGFQNRSVVSGKSVDFFRMPQTDSLQNSYMNTMEDPVAVLVTRPARQMASQPRPSEDVFSNRRDAAMDQSVGQNRKGSLTKEAGSEKARSKAASASKENQADQAVSHSKRLLKLAAKSGDAKEIVKVIKQLNQQIETMTADQSAYLKLKLQIWQSIKFTTLIQLLKHPSAQVAYASLQLMNQLSERDQDKQSLLVAAGLIPQLVRLCLKDYSPDGEVTQREVKVEIAYFIGQVFQDSKKQLMAQYLACEGYRIQLAFLDLEYHSNMDLVMIAIDSFLVIFEECTHLHQSHGERKRSRSRESKDKEKQAPAMKLDHKGITSLLIGEGLIARLVALIPQVIHHADLSTSHKDQSNAETIIERIFEVLVNLATNCDLSYLGHFCSEEVRTNLCDALLEQTKDPQQLTFLTTRQYLKLLQALTNVNQSDQEQEQLSEQAQQLKIVKKLAKANCAQTLAEILSFYTSLIEHIQLSSIYDCLKLLNLFCKFSPLNLVQPMTAILQHIETNQISIGKKVRLLNLILSITTEVVQSGDLGQLFKCKMHFSLMQVLRSAHKYNSQINQMWISGSDLRQTGVQSGMAMHLHQKSMQGKKPANEIALKTMEIFVLWIQKEEDKSPQVQKFLSQKSSLETFFNVFVSPVRRNPQELLKFLISLHKMLLQSDLLVDTLLSQDLLVSHLQSQIVLICNQLDSIQTNVSRDPLGKSSSSTKSAIGPSGAPKQGLVGASQSMLASLNSQSMAQVPNTTSQRQRHESSLVNVACIEQFLTPQQGGQLLKELLEIFQLLLQAKKASDPLNYFDFVIRFDLPDTLTLLQRSAQRKQLAQLADQASSMLNELYPQYTGRARQSPSRPTGFHDLQQVEPVQIVEDQPLLYDDFDNLSGFEDHLESDDQSEMIVTQSSQALSPMFNFNQSSQNAVIAKGFPNQRR